MTRKEFDIKVNWYTFSRDNFFKIVFSAIWKALRGLCEKVWEQILSFWKELYV